ncbi:MAG: glycosyltransferase, partial [Planctomycetes bacterium]|nr:glycosyltransferase [Planctomycetota bacterium]
MKPAKKIYLISQHFPPAALALKLYWYACELQEAGFDVTVITALQPVTGFEDPDYDNFKPSFEIVRLPVKHWGWGGKLLSLAGLPFAEESNWHWAVANYLKRRLQSEPGILLALYPPAASLTGCLQVTKSCGCPVVVDFREPFEPEAKKTSRWHRIEQQIVTNADLVSVSTEQLRADLLRVHGLDQGKVVVTHNGFAGPLPPARVNTFTHSPLRCVYAGGLSKREQPEIFCHAWWILQARHPELARQVHLTFYGLPTRYEKKSLLPLLQEGFLEFSGFVSAGALRRIIATADLGLVALADPVWNQQVPGRIFDYLAHGKPILAALPEGEASAIIKHSGAGIVV